MTDAATVRVEDNTKEQVAYKLLELIGKAEKKQLNGASTADRAWILKTYALCLLSVRDPGNATAYIDAFK
ncbi:MULTISPECIES: hypothetical protein [unclassified Bradyrhizobium]|uniref:hypothetical protein n=1 Tax=unclassified Bradyrhizobium TaxID=2631580 RepID=UPI002916ECF8|nr:MULTISPECIES: hypothetical protein [unclassified Bradyrhizobium]